MRNNTYEKSFMRLQTLRDDVLDTSPEYFNQTLRKLYTGAMQAYLNGDASMAEQEYDIAESGLQEYQELILLKGREKLKSLAS